jgi:AraC family transcriptional regulator
MSSRDVAIRLDGAPHVANAGRGIHGVASLRDVFTLPDLWQFHLYSYSADLIIDGIEYRIRPGHVSLAPPGSLVEYRYQGRSEHLYVHFRAGETGAAQFLPAVQDAGQEQTLLTDLLSQVVTHAVRAPARASAELWTALWRVAQLPTSDGHAAPHPAVALALNQIEVDLAKRLTVAQLARAAHISHNHLTRLFREHTGRTVVAHIRHSRLQRARHLLQHSSLPIATIAAAVGIPDLQAFNKACRRELGQSPRSLRSRA